MINRPQARCLGGGAQQGAAGGTQPRQRVPRLGTWRLEVTRAGRKGNQLLAQEDSGASSSRGTRKPTAPKGRQTHNLGNEARNTRPLAQAKQRTEVVNQVGGGPSATRQKPAGEAV